MKTIALAAALLAAGCASMVNGRFQDINVGSSPPGAAITLACAGVEPQHAGYTPATIRLRRSDEGCWIAISKLGYEEEMIWFQRVRSAATVLDAVPAAVLGGITGLVVRLPAELILPKESAEELGEAAFAAGASVPYAVDERSGAAFKQVPDGVRVELVPRP